MVCKELIDPNDNRTFNVVSYQERQNRFMCILSAALLGHVQENLLTL